MPRTIEDYHDVLTAFKTELGVESPLWMSMYGAYQNHAFSSAFGVTALTTTNLSAPFYVEDGQVYFGPIQDGMKQYLATMAQWYEEGLIYSDFMTVSNNFFPDFSLIQELGVYTIPVGIFNQMGMYSTDEDFAISASYDPVLNEGDTQHITYSSDDILVSGLCITSECSDPVLAAQYIDFWYSEEGFYILNYGVEGETYELNESGDPVYITDVVFADDTLTTDQCLMLVSKQSGSFVIDYLNRQSVAFNDAQMEAFDIWGEAQDDYLYPTNALLNTEESELYAQMYPELATYIQQYIPAVIIGDIDLDSSWDEYIATCEELGSEECTAVKQAAYDRYLAR